ncbi:MAG TPA: FHA domain-containing protein [Kofleriaceae bacterium]|nr:FHA domain-containing protein [Kofleriaceae bacterium]
MQGPTTTDVGMNRWLINDEVIRLRVWASERSQPMPASLGGEWIIGSGPTSWLRLEDERRRVSRKHASLSREDGKWILRDAGSKNGIIVEGMRRNEVALEPGVEIWVGGVTLIAESSRLAALRVFLGRILGWTSDQVRTVDLALRSIRSAAIRQVAIALCGDGDLVLIARALHRHTLGADRPFILCDPRRRSAEETVRGAENHQRGMEALRAANRGSLCIWNERLPRDFADVRIALQDPDTRVQLIVCGRQSTDAFGVVPITIPPLRRRASELSQIVGEYAKDAAIELGLPDTPFAQSDRDWVMRHAAGTLAEIEKTTQRLLAIRETGGNLNAAAAVLRMARWSLAKWVSRRGLPDGLRGRMEPRRGNEGR